MQNNYSNPGSGASFDSSCEQEFTYAGFWARACAYLIDSIFLFVILLVVRIILWAVMGAASGTALGGNLIFRYNLKDIVLYLLKVLYFVLFTCSSGATLGKKAMNLKVISTDPEGNPSLFTVVYRETIGRFLSGVIAGIGYLMIGIDQEKRGLHDILCDTRVVYAKKVTVYETQVGLPIQVPTYQTSWKETSGDGGSWLNQEETPRASEDAPVKSEPYEPLKEELQGHGEEPKEQKVLDSPEQKTFMPWDAPFE